MGVVLYVLVCGSLPFDGPTLHALRNVVIEGKFRIPYFMSQDCEHLIRHMLVVEPEKRLTLSQIARHRWLSDTPPVDTGPEQQELQLNKTVIDHMLQLPGLNQNMIVQSLKTNSFDHIYAIYNLLVDKLHQRTMHFQSKLDETEMTSHQNRAPKMSERSGSFNERLNESTEGMYSNRRESFNENCLRKEEENAAREKSEDVGSPFVSMPTIPAVYLMGDGEGQPLEKFGEMDLDASEATLTTTSSGYGTLGSDIWYNHNNV